MTSDTANVAIVADDLTGALDVAGPFASRGLTTWVVVDRHACAPARLAQAHVVSVNCASRHLAAADAAAAVGDAVARFCPPGAGVFIKKIDSTLRGNVVAETLAAMAATGRRTSIVVPAFPAQGRTLVKGRLHVAGVPLQDTDFARDVLSPPPLEPLPAVFARSAPDIQVREAGPEGPFDFAATLDTRRIVVVDSETDEDLRRTVLALRSRLQECVLVGSAGIAAAVARECPKQDRAAERPRVEDGVLIAVGSRAQASAAQVQALCERGDAAVVLAPNGELRNDEPSPDGARILVVKTAPASDGQARPAEQVAAALARNVVRLLRSRGAGALVATGGDTAVAILHALGCDALQVMGDLLPGIPYCRIQPDARPLWLVSKAGGFGTRETLVDIVQRLERGG
jgi:uncharacterized protein YgbK (DUF1537 family)